MAVIGFPFWDLLTFVLATVPQSEKEKERRWKEASRRRERESERERKESGELRLDALDACCEMLARLKCHFAAYSEYVLGIT